MKAIDSKPIEALAYQKAAALEAQGYGDLAKAAIQSGEEQQSAADKAAEAQKQAAQKAEEAAKQAQEAAKQAQEAAKQAAATYQQEVDAAQTAQGQIAGVYAQYDKMYSDDEAKLNTALHGKHDLTAAEAQAELASVQQSMQQQIQAVNTAIGTVEALKRQETGVMTAEDRKQLDSQVATAQGELTAAQNAYTEMATTATNDQAIIDAAAKQTTQDIIQGIHDQVAEQDKLRTEDTSRFSHNLATQKDLFDASLSYAIESHKKGLDAQQQAVEDAQNNLARIQAAGQAAALRADAELQRREIDLEEAKAQMEIDLATAELTAKTGVWNAELSLSSSTSAAQVTDAQAVGRANVDAATAAENAWVPAYIKIDEAALNHAQIQVDAAQTAKQYAIEAAAAATKAAQQALQNAQDASSTASAAISKTAQDATDAWGRSVKAMEDNAKGLEATMGKVAGSIGEMLSSAFNVGGGAGSSGSSGLFGTNSSPQPSFGGGGGSGSGSGSGWAPPQTPPSIPAWAQAQGYWEGQTGYFNGGPVYQLMQGDSIVPGGGALLQQWANNPSNPATPIGPAVTIGNVKEVAAAVASAIATGQTTLIQQNGYAPGLTVGK